MKILIVIDLQNDFITGSLGTPEAQAIVHKVCEKIVNWDGETFLTQDTHFDNYLNTQEGKKLPIKHCIVDTEGWELNKDVQNAITKSMTPYFKKRLRVHGLLAFQKKTFGAERLLNYLKDIHLRQKIEEIQLIGLCTDICVISNALLFKTFLPEVPIIVDASCCAGVTPESHKNALEAMKMCQIEIINE